MKKRRRNAKKVTSRKHLRAGSSEVKRILLEQHPFCDICGSPKALQLHHIYLIRHGFKTKLEHCCLLCANDHADFHHRWDKYLDEVYRNDHDADFLKIYNVLKKL